MLNGSAPNNESLDKIDLPDLVTLKRLAISESGFIFDPESGHSFNVNETGMFILKQLQDQSAPNQILQSIVDEYDISPREAERDLIEYIGLLREKIQGF